MNIQLHKPEWHRLEHAFIWIAVLAAMLFFLAPRAAHLERFVTAPMIETHVPQSAPAPPVSVLPFTAADVAQYFSTALEMAPEQAGNGATVFENRQVIFPEDRWRIAVSAEGKGVVVEFAVGGDYGLSLAREFFESPLFNQVESEHLLAMLDRAANAPVEKTRRFTLAMTFAEATDLQMLVVRFTPHEAS